MNTTGSLGPDREPGKRAVLVVGMHRSGTSAVTRVLNYLGCALPNHLSGIARDNERGFWESPAIRDLNERILKSAGTAWDDWVAFDPSWYESPRANEFRGDARTVLEDEFGESPAFVLKDPRICRLLPLWIDAVRCFGAEPLIVSPIRNPLDVAASLEARDGIDPSIGLLMWLRSLLDAERASRDVERLFLRYERLLDAPREVVKQLKDSLGVEGVTQPAEACTLIDGFLSPDLRHHRAEDSSVLANPDVSRWLRSSFDIVHRWTVGDVRTEDWSALDRIREDFDVAAPAFSRAVEVGLEKTRELRDKTRALHETTQVLEETTQVLDERTRAWHETTHELNERNREFHATRETLSEREEENRGLSLELATTGQILDERTRAWHETTHELNERNRDLHATRETLSEREEENRGLSLELAVTEETLSGRDSEIARLATQLREIRASTSWRLTIPFRYVGTVVKRGVRLARFVLLAFRTPRSGLEALRRLLAALRQGGMTEVRNKLRLLLEDGEGAAQVAVSPEDRWTEFARPSADSEPDVFMFSIIDWSFRFQRSQHLAVELARAGRRVFYVEMLLEPSGLNIAKLDTNLYRVRLPAGDIGYIQPYTGQATPEQRMAWFEAFLLLCDAVAATSFKQIIIQHPFWWQMTRSIPPEFQLIYDCMDDIAGFSNTDRFVLDLEEAMVESCDALIVTSDALFEKYHGVKLPRLIRNAANVEHFSPGGGNRLSKFRQDLPSLSLRNSDAESAEGSLINVGYVGAIADWFDAELVRSVAASEPDFRIHLCGAVSSRKVNRALEDAENVFFYGEIPYVDVPSFLERMDVLVIPFRIIPIIESCDPVKFYEYSAVGKPTVATRLPELERASDLVFFASAPDEFSRQIRNACEKGQDPDFQDRLKNYASQNTWTQRCGELVGVLRDLPLVSVVILSYGDPELTKTAMHSLFDGGPTYPRMEVLIVDNGSSSSNLAGIKAFAAGYPDVEVIENGSNLGFARGNNVGLERATGEYVLLLNNDTFVAPGAVHAMARHLRDNPEIGAVGPLTNNIGNEAKVFVRYGDMDQMKKTTRRITLGYRGRFLDVGALGYFAVMFRRKDLESFGLLPLDYGLGMFEDDDHCRTIQSKGYVTAVAEDGFVHHHLSASFDRMDGSQKKALFERNREIFERKWGPWKAHQYRRSRPERRL